jgi:hypothetical protein
VRAQSDGISEYLLRSGAEAVVYSGKVESPYPGMTGHPYMDTDEYREGTLWFDQRLYPAVLLRLNTHTDEIALLSPDRSCSVIVPSDRVDRAVLPEYTIVRHHQADKEDVKQRRALAEGYYAYVHQGKFPVIRREVRYPDQKVNGMQLERTFALQSRTYIYKDGIYHAAGSKGNVLKLFGDRRRELNRYIRQEGLDFRNNRLGAIVALVRYYESLSNNL